MATWLILLAVLIVALAAAGASWAVVRREKTRLGFLLETTQALLEARDLDFASVELLQRASVRFGADCAELTLLPETGTGAFRTTVRAGEPVDVMRSGDLEDDDGTLRPPIFGVVHIAEAAPDPWATRLCGRLAVSRGLAVTLRHGSRTVGYLALGMRASQSPESRADDEQLQEFANQVALTIQRSRLHDGLVKLAALQSELADRAFHDPLTQLANRALFVERTERALLECDPERQVVSLVSVDLEDFRSINAKHGRAAGDAVLVEVARRLHECLRRTDMAARLGGDEFALLLPEVLHPREAELIAQRVVEALAAPVSTEGGSVPITASVGLACAKADDTSASALLRQATAAAKEAREAGSSTYRIHGGSTAGSTDADLAEELESALNKGELVVHYQPIVELRTGIILGSEALVRWQHPVRGLLTPLNFLPVAVEYGLIDRIEEFVMRTACDQLKRWQAAYPATPELAMSVNVSAGGLKSGSVVDLVTRCLARVGVDPSSLILEFTENVVLEDLHRAISTFDGLQRTGAHVAIDDVGTGYTSLAYLRRLPIDILKIARPLVAELGDPSSSGELARTVVRHGEAMHLALVAEGVELPLQVKRLNQLGCVMAQGYHLAPPCDAEAIEALLRKGGLDPGVYGRVRAVEAVVEKATLVTAAPAAVAPVTVSSAHVAPPNGARSSATAVTAIPAAVAAAQVAPSNGAPAKAASSSVAPVIFTPAAVTPAQVVPSNGAPAKAASSSVAPVIFTPAAVTPAQVAPSNGGPAKAASSSVSPVIFTPAAVPPAQVAPAQRAPAALALATVTPAQPDLPNGARAKVAPAVVAPPNGASEKAARAAVAPVTVTPMKVAAAPIAPPNGASATAVPASVAPMTTAPMKLAPTKAAPAQTASAKAAPLNVVPTKAAPGRPTTAKVAPVKASPEHLLPPEAAPATPAPVTVTPTHVVPAHADMAQPAPAEAASATLASALVVPPNAAQAKVATVTVAPVKIARAKVARAKVAPAHTAVAKAALLNVVPAKAAPAKATTARVAPVKASPVDLVPPEAAPATPVPATVTPAQVAPAHADMAQTPPAEVASATPASALVFPPNADQAKVAPVKAAPAKVAPAKTAPTKVTRAKAGPPKAAASKAVRGKAAPAKVTRAKVPSRKVARAKAGPAKVAPAKRAAAKVAPARRTPAKAVPAKRTPAKVAPAKRAAAKVAPARRTPTKVAPTRRTPAKAAPARRTPAKAAPARRTPAKAAPASRTPAKVAPARRTPAKVAPARRTPAKAAPARRTPAKVAPARRTPAKAAPARRTPAKVAPARRIPAKAAPSRRTPAKVAPAKRTPAKVAPATRKSARPRRVPSTGARARNTA
jgi:diguanylate cyclase (GGDEF)-like protein